MVQHHAQVEKTCDAAGCDEPLPMDLPWVRIGIDVGDFCSAACARSFLDENDTHPSRVTLYDPQFNVDRSALPNVPPDCVPIQRPVSDVADARDAVDELAEMLPRPFRVDADA